MIERINLENYEAYFLDFAEGNLTATQKQQLELFLEEHPHLHVELEEFEAVFLEEDTALSGDLKSELRREETTGLLLPDYLMISEIEGTINSNEKAQLSELIKQSPEKMSELAAYHKTKLSPKENIVFEEKSALIQKEKRVIAWWTYASSVAAAILFMLFWNFNSIDQQYSPREFAWQTGIIEYNKPIQYRFLAQERAKPSINEEKKVVSSSPTSRTFADNRSSKPSPTIDDQNPEKASLPLAGREENIVNEEELAEKEAVGTKKTPEMDHEGVTVEDEVFASNEPVVKAEEEFVPIQEFAKNKIKNEVLKGKTFSETVMDEIADVSNEKITFERTKDKTGNTQKFALNIGKFSISKNK